MSHDLSFNVNGNAELALADTGAWHHFGTVFSGPIPLEQAIAIACPWEGMKEQLIRPSTGQVSEAYGIYRSDNGKEIGTCSASYEMVQPREMFTFTEGLNIPGYESAGALKGGSVLFVSARVGEVNVLGSGDITRTYVAFLNSFDGSIAAQAFLTGTRIVCQNTLQASLRNQQGRVLKFKHTKNVHNRLEQAKAIMESQQSAQEALQAAFDALAQRTLKRATYEAILEELFPGEATKTKNVKAEVTALFADNDNQFIPEFAGTAYAVLNAVTNYVDHHARVRLTKTAHNTDAQSQRFESAILGTGAELKTRALERILVLTNGSEACESAPIVSMPPKNVTPRYLPDGNIDVSHWNATQERPIGFQALPMVSSSDTDYADDKDDASHTDYTAQATPYMAFCANCETSINLHTDLYEAESGHYLCEMCRPVLVCDRPIDTSEVWSEPTDFPSQEYGVLYTTADVALDMPGVTLDDIVEKISDTVAVRRVMVPTGILDSQKQAYTDAGCLAVNHEEWTALKR